MPRYFLELAYKGTQYSGFQVQENAVTIQSEVEKALQVFFRKEITLTGSSRTDAGVHALQNFFHFDDDGMIKEKELYHLNAILPQDIALKNIFKMGDDDCHCRFDAIAREYKYYIYQNKNPFYIDRAWFYPYKLNVDLLRQSAETILQYTDFTSFSKRNTQVNNFLCHIQYSRWEEQDDFLVYTTRSNRFLRGMVRGLVGTMLRVARGKISLQEFKSIIEAKDCTMADFSTPPQGLFLAKVIYPENYFQSARH